MDDLPDPADHEAIYVTPAVKGAPVDPPDERRPVFAAVVSKSQPRRPIVPAALRSREQRRQLGEWAIRYGLHTAAYHLTRSPKYAVKTLLWAPVGLWTILRTTGGWAYDTPSWQMAQKAATADDFAAYVSMTGKRDKHASLRLWVFWPILLAIVVSIIVAWVAAPRLYFWMGVCIVLPMLAWVGRPKQRPIVDRVVQRETYRKLTADMVRKAIVATGKVKDPGDVVFRREIVRDGPGYLAIPELPDGVVAEDIIEERAKLAGGLRLPLDQVWPSHVKGEHPGVLELWVADRPVSAMKQPRSPLLDSDFTADYFRPFPYGFDPRLRPVMWRLDERNSLFGGVPGSGKSLAVRNVVLGAVLDPLVVPALFELKGTGDFDVLEDLCPDGLYGSGADERTKRGAMAMLDWLLDECERRPPLIKRYVQQGLSRENKLNRAMASRDERLRPILAVVDEVQELFTDPDLGKRAIAVATSVIKRGRALGIHLILATQRIDKDSIPKGISSNIVMRLCLAVTSHIECDLVLGTGAYRSGARPTQFEPGEDAGWGWRAGLGPSAPARAAYLDNAAAERIAKRAIGLRGGVRADVEQRPDRDVLADVIRVFAHLGRPAIHWQRLAELLAEAQPDTYKGLTAEAASALVRAAGVPSVDVKADGIVLKGCRRAEVEDAQARRAVGR